MFLAVDLLACSFHPPKINLLKMFRMYSVTPISNFAFDYSTFLKPLLIGTVKHPILSCRRGSALASLGLKLSM